jgi:hypothetical protein
MNNDDVYTVCGNTEKRQPASQPASQTIQSDSLEEASDESTTVSS